MDRGHLLPLRALPRFFIPGQAVDEPFEIPAEEYRKIHQVLRLRSGDSIAVLPNDGSVVRCVLEGKRAIPGERELLQTDAVRRVTLAQSLPRQEKLEEVVRMGTELGVAKFLLFTSDRTIVRWDAKKIQEKLRRLHAIAREASEVCFRAKLPEIEWVADLKAVFGLEPESWVLSEVEGVEPHLMSKLRQLGPDQPVTLVVGPEGGWAPREVEEIGARAVTMGPRVFRVDTAAAAAAALSLLSS